MVTLTLPTFGIGVAMTFEAVKPHSHRSKSETKANAFFDI